MFKDGSGVYNWREFKKHSNIEQNSPLYQRPFVNGTHYLYKDIGGFLFKNVKIRMDCLCFLILICSYQK